MSVREDERKTEDGTITVAGSAQKTFAVRALSKSWHRGLSVPRFLQVSVTLHAYPRNQTLEVLNVVAWMDRVALAIRENGEGKLGRPVRTFPICTSDLEAMTSCTDNRNWVRDVVDRVRVSPPPVGVAMVRFYQVPMIFRMSGLVNKKTRTKKQLSRKKHFIVEDERVFTTNDSPTNPNNTNLFSVSEIIHQYNSRLHDDVTIMVFQ